ncbi:MAG: SDR family oxidoreductase [Acidobacteriota bacterium]|nr:SDR family oxidoreductase [Acidobacteriota bacterium]MDE3031753.1 SDR family oxidoreductase [Acidobacteriota bacterium]MDE3094210.1 SDR family oxidoreductase [Acidobacteriota bacterium]
MRIEDSNALVTGGNRGLGRHLAVELISRGANVWVGARRPDTVDVPGARTVPLDITDPVSVARAAELIGDTNLLINNAGISTGANLLSGGVDDIRLEFETHVFGTLSVVRAFAPRMIASGGGTILNILSVLSWISFPGAGAYSAAKSAQWSMTNALRSELADHDVRVVGLHVGYMDTDMTASIDAVKSDPRDIARIAVDGIESDAYEILADELSRHVQLGLAAGVAGLYPQLAGVGTRPQ